MIRARFRVPLARWRRRVARNTLRWFLGRLHTIEAFRKAIKTYFRVVRMVQGTWRRRTLRVRASLRLCKVQWDRVFFSRPDVSEPLPDQIIDRALRNLIHSVHNQTTKKFGKLFGASILDKQENLFPTKELVEDEVMLNHINMIESYVRQKVPGWTLPGEEPNAGAVSHDDIEHTKLGGLVKQVRKTRARTKRPPPRPKPGAFKTGTPAAE